MRTTKLGRATVRLADRVLSRAAVGASLPLFAGVQLGAGAACLPWLPLAARVWGHSPVLALGMLVPPGMVGAAVGVCVVAPLVPACALGGVLLLPPRQ